MRKYIILFALCLFFAAIGYYLAHTLNPFDETQIAQLVHSEKIAVSAEFEQVINELMDKGLISEFLNVRNVVILASTILLSVLSGFMFFHLALDKLFFRKFYEQPSLVLALRRGLFVCLGLVSIFIYRLFAAEWYLTVLTLGLLLIVEMVIGRIAPVKVQLEIPEAAANEETDSNAVVEATTPVAKPRKGLRERLAKVRQLPGQFRDTVMRQVGESQDALPSEDTDFNSDISSEDEHTA